MKKEDNWVCTDPSCNQYRKDISAKVFLFKEDRIINPETKEIEVFESEISLDDYTRTEIFDYCVSFGYNNMQVNEWLCKGINYDLIAECIFEMEN